MRAVEIPWQKVAMWGLGWTLHVSVAAQVKWSADTTQIQWGEPLTLTAEWMLSLESLQEGMADESAWPNWTDTTTSGFEVLSSTPIDTVAAELETGADVVLRKSWMLTSWDSGFVVLPPERFGPHETEPLLVRVVTPQLAADAQPQPAADIVGVHWTWLERLAMAWRWLLLLAIVLLSVLCARWLLRRWKGRAESEGEETLPAPPPEQAHVIALRELERIKRNEGWTRGLAKEVQAEASLALRVYLEGRFGLPAAERTTEEIGQLLPMSSVPTSWHDRLLLGLSQADVVKFAKGQLADATHVATLDAFIEFVMDTKAEDHEEE